MRYLSILLLWLILAILQISFLPELLPIWLVPSMLACEEVILLREGKLWNAFFLAIFFGLLTDAYSSAFFGVSTLAYSVSAFTLEGMYRTVLPRGPGVWSIFMPVLFYFSFLILVFAFEKGFTLITNGEMRSGFWNLLFIGSAVSTIGWMSIRSRLQDGVLKTIYEN